MKYGSLEWAQDLLNSTKAELDKINAADEKGKAAAEGLGLTSYYTGLAKALEDEIAKGNYISENEMLAKDTTSKKQQGEQQGECYLFRKAIDERNLDLLIKVWNRASPEEQKILLDNCSDDQRDVFMGMYNNSYGLSPNGEPDFDYDAHIEEINDRKAAEAERMRNNFDTWIISNDEEDGVDGDWANFMIWAAKPENHKKVSADIYAVDEYDLYNQFKTKKGLEKKLLDAYKKAFPEKNNMSGSVIDVFNADDTEPDSTPLSSNIIDAVNRPY